MNFSNAIVRTPGESLVEGITSANLGKPDYSLALEQHRAYVDTLRECGLYVEVIQPDERYPDSTFVEDTAVLAGDCAIITNPGAPTRKGEEIEIRLTLGAWFSRFERIAAPGTLEGGDVMRVGDAFYIGQSARTNRSGGEQLVRILRDLGFSASLIPVTGFLHLKTGMSHIGDDTILLAGEFVDRPEFGGMRRIVVSPDEEYAVNCLRLNEFIVMPSGFPATRKALDEAGFMVKETPMSEFRKIDGGLTCLSLRF